MIITTPSNYRTWLEIEKKQKHFVIAIVVIDQTQEYTNKPRLTFTKKKNTEQDWDNKMLNALPRTFVEAMILSFLEIHFYFSNQKQTN